MKFRFLLLSILLLFVPLFGCSSNKTVDPPDAGIPVAELNRDLAIEIVPMFNTFKIGECVHLLVHLKSDIEVRTTNNFNARPYVLSPDKSEWQEVQEVPDLGIFEPIDIVMNLKEEPLDETSFCVRPRIQSQGNPVKLLVMITGDVYEDGQKTDQKVGAYTIVTLKP